MRHYCGTFVENWGCNEKRLFWQISYKKTPVHFSDTDAAKSEPNWKTRFPQTKNKRRWNVSCSKTETIVYRNLRLKNSVKILAKASLIEKKRHSVPSSPIVFVRMKIVPQCNLRFFLLTSSISLFNFNEFFLFYPILVCKLFEKPFNNGVSVCYRAGFELL